MKEKWAISVSNLYRVSPKTDHGEFIIKMRISIFIHQHIGRTCIYRIHEL